MRAAHVRSDGINETTSVQRSTERGKIGRVEPVNYLQQLQGFLLVDCAKPNLTSYPMVGKPHLTSLVPYSSTLPD